MGVRCSKAIDEFLALVYHRERGLPVTYRAAVQHRRTAPAQGGARMAIPNFVRQALAGEPITVFGDGHQTRSFGYVGDIVEGIIRRPLRTGPSDTCSTSATQRRSPSSISAGRVKAATRAAIRRSC